MLHLREADKAPPASSPSEDASAGDITVHATDSTSRTNCSRGCPEHKPIIVKRTKRPLQRIRGFNVPGTATCPHAAPSPAVPAGNECSVSALYPSSPRELWAMEGDAFHWIHGSTSVADASGGPAADHLARRAGRILEGPLGHFDARLADHVTRSITKRIRGLLAAGLPAQQTRCIAIRRAQGLVLVSLTCGLATVDPTRQAPGAEVPKVKAEWQIWILRDLTPAGAAVVRQCEQLRASDAVRLLSSMRLAEPPAGTLGRSFLDRPEIYSSAATDAQDLPEWKLDASS